MDTVPTPSQTVGPFFHVCLTAPEHCISRIAGPKTKGERAFLVCRIFDGEGAPVPDAMIEIWQADADGHYHSVGESPKGSADPSWRGFGRMGTSEDGSCKFETIKPGRVSGQAPHLEIAVFARGMLKQLFTRIYFAGDPANQEDAVLNVVQQERRQTLIAQPDPGEPGHWQFDIFLQGEQETVFFDV